jgi:hypothetical protein
MLVLFRVAMTLAGAVAKLCRSFGAEFFNEVS